MKRSFIYMICGLLSFVFNMQVTYAQKLPKSVTYEGAVVDKKPVAFGSITGTIHSYHGWNDGFNEDGTASFCIMGDFFPFEESDYNLLLQGYKPAIREQALKKIYKAGTFGKIQDAIITSPILGEGVIKCGTVHYVYNKKQIEFWIEQGTLEIEFDNGAICTIEGTGITEDGNNIISGLVRQFASLQGTYYVVGSMNDYTDKMNPFIIGNGAFSFSKIGVYVKLDKFPEEVTLPKPYGYGDKYERIFGSKMAEQKPVIIDLEMTPDLYKVASLTKGDIATLADKVYFRNGGYYSCKTESIQMKWDNGDYIDNDRYHLTLKDGTKIEDVNFYDYSHSGREYTINYTNGDYYYGTLALPPSYDEPFVLAYGNLKYADGTEEKVIDGTTESELRRLEEIEERTRQTEKQKKVEKLAAIYGTQNAEDILNRKVRLGMSREVILAMPIAWEPIRTYTIGESAYEILRGIPFDPDDPDGSIMEIGMIKALAAEFGRDPYKYITLKNGIVVSIE